MTLDARLGSRDGSGAYTAKPTQFSDGSSATGDVISSGTLCFLTDTYFCLLRPGTPELDDDTRTTLLAAVGSSGVIGTLTAVRSSLGLEPVSNVGIFDDFIGSTLDTDLWLTDLSSSATVSLPNTTGYTLAKAASTAVDETHATLTSALSFVSSADALLIETRLRLSHITDIVCEFGVSDARSETNGIAFSSHDVTPVAVASNAVVLGFQHDSGGEQNTTWNALRVNADTATRSDTTITPTTSFVTLAIALAKNGSAVDVSYFIDGAQVATAQGVIALNIPVNAWLTVKAKSAAIRYVEVDYLRVYAKR